MEEVDKMMQECEVWENEGVTLYDCGTETRKLTQQISTQATLKYKKSKIYGKRSKQDLVEGDQVFYGENYQFQGGEMLGDHFLVISPIDQGKFGQVVKILDMRTKRKTYYAAKISNNIPHEVENAKYEIELMKKLQEPHIRDNEGHDQILQMVDNFIYDNRVVILSNHLGLNLYNYQQNRIAKLKKKQVFSKKQMKTTAKQMCQGLKFMKNKSVIHCDLKLENILFTDSKCKNIRLIDFGAGCESYENGYTYVQSRYYRAPETVLGIPYDHQIDMWSVGCILYEMAVGSVLFPGQDENEMIEYWIITIDAIPQNMLEESN